ncbi:MAG: capsule assembly Wzi family protein, partial [Salinibacter sp.]|uniref:capsule assembly Wzi family protein n=1 Tax=Salinibacter sp. TaxID=2065818 RepID=UPI0035D48FB3
MRFRSSKPPARSRARPPHRFGLGVLWVVLLWALVGGFLQPAGAQAPADSLRASVTLFGAAGTGDRLPFWLRANQRGTVDPASANAGLRLSTHRPFVETSGLNYSFGATFLGRASQNGTVTIHELYGRLQYGWFQLTAGRREQTVGRVDTSLSLGSVVRSRNAPPIPRVTLSSDGYVPVPGTGGALAARGHLTHGWLEEDRFVEGALLHEKALYLRFFPSDFSANVHAGITHHVQWGGTSPLRGPQNSSFREWVDVAFLTDVVFTDDRTQAESQRSQANHIAMYDFSLNVDLGDWRGLAYRQFYHEDVASLWFR